MGDAADRPTPPSLLLRVRDPADAAAWRTFVDIYGPLVYGYCRSARLAHEDAEDVTQEVFGRVNEAIRTFEYRDGSAGGPPLPRQVCWRQSADVAFFG